MHYSPFRHSNRTPKGTFAFDLHVLATPPAFDLSQDQTLRLIIADPNNPEGPSGNQHWKLILVAEAHKGPRPGTHVNVGAKLKILYRACHEDVERTACSKHAALEHHPAGPNRDCCRTGAATSSRRHTLFTFQIALNTTHPPAGPITRRGSDIVIADAATSTWYRQILCLFLRRCWSPPCGPIHPRHP